MCCAINKVSLKGILYVLTMRYKVMTSLVTKMVTGLARIVVEMTSLVTQSN